MARGLVPYPAEGMARALFQSMARGLVPYLHQLKGMERLLSSPALRAGRTTQPLKQQQTLQSSRRLERQSSQEAPGRLGVWHGYGSREGKECALHLSMWPRYGTGMARDIAAGLGKL